MTTPITRAANATQTGGRTAAARPLATRPIPKISAAPIARSVLFRRSPGAIGGVRVIGPGASAGSGSGASRASATSSMSPTGTSVVERSADDMTTPAAITASATPAARPTVSPSAMAMTAATAALGRDDRRDDRDLADRQGRVGEHQAEAVAQPRDEEQHEDEGVEGRGERRDDGERQADDGPDRHDPGEHDQRPEHPARARASRGWRPTT